MNASKGRKYCAMRFYFLKGLPFWWMVLSEVESAPIPRGVWLAGLHYTGSMVATGQLVIASGFYPQSSTLTATHYQCDIFPPY